MLHMLRSLLLCALLFLAVIVTALVAASGGLLFGFDNGITGGGVVDGLVVELTSQLISRQSGMAD